MTSPSGTTPPAPTGSLNVVEREAPVVLLSPGRSGSTLLQTLLNTHPELTVWGEHRGILNSLLDALDQVSNCEWIDETMRHGDWLLEPVRHVDEHHWSAWDGPFSRQDFRRGLRDLVDTLFRLDQVRTRRWGFKEIRYSKTNWMRRLLSLYPQSQFLLLLRDPAKACTSFVSATMRSRNTPESGLTDLVKEIAEHQIRPFFRFVPKALRNWPEQTLVVSFESLTGNPHQELARLGHFLRLETDFDPKAVNRIMSVNLVSERDRNGRKRLKLIEAIAARELAVECDWYASWQSGTGNSALEAEQP